MKRRQDIQFTEQDVLALLAKRYCAPEYAFIPQVRNATGLNSSVRTADAIAMGLWPSRGMEVQGFEVKVNRGDFLDEIRAPEKAEEIARFVDRWWLVVPDEKIIGDGELPSGWGLLVVRGDKIACAREAPKLNAAPLDRVFIAALLRSVATKLVTNEQQELRDLRELVSRFQGVSGIRFREKWPHAEATAEAVRLVVESKSDFAQQRISRMLDSSRRMTEVMEAMQRAAFEGGMPR